MTVRVEKIKHFEDAEFNCKCSYECGKGYADMEQAFLKKLNLARRYSNTPYVINSAVRCWQHNVDVDGKSNSAHLTGYAVDIEARTSARRARILFGLVKAGFHRIGIYENFIHVDNDPTKPAMVVWLGA